MSIKYVSFLFIFFYYVSSQQTSNNNGNNPQNNSTQIPSFYSITSFIKIAGGGDTSISDGNSGLKTQLNFPQGIGFDLINNLIFISDTVNQRIRKFDRNIGIISTICGNGTSFSSGDNDLAIKATIFNPSSLIFESSLNSIFFIENGGNNKIRKINQTSGIISTIYQTNITSIQISDLIYNKNNNSIIFSTTSSSNTYDKILNLNLNSNSTTILINQNGISGFSGDANFSLNAQINNPKGLSIDFNNNLLFFCDSENRRIRKVDLDSGIISTIVGGGNINLNGNPNSINPLNLNLSSNIPNFLSFDSQNNILFISSSFQIFEFNLSSNLIRIIANLNNNFGSFSGDNFDPINATFNGINQIFFQKENNNPNGFLFLSDSRNNRIRQINFGNNSKDNIIKTLIGDGNGFSIGDNSDPNKAVLNGVYSLIFDSFGDLLSSDSGNNRIRKIFGFNSINPIIRTIIGDENSGNSGDGNLANFAQLNNPRSIFFDTQNNLFILDFFNYKIRWVNSSNIINTFLIGNPINSIVFNNKTNIVYIGSSFPAILQLNLSSLNFNFNNISFNFNDPENILIKKKPNIIDGKNSTLIGDNLNVKNASISLIGNNNFIIDSINNFLYLADSYYNRIRKIDLNSNIITTICGNGSDFSSGNNDLAIKATTYLPSFLSLDNKNNILYFIERNFGFTNYLLRKINFTSGIIFDFNNFSSYSIYDPLLNQLLNNSINSNFQIYSFIIDSFGNLIFSTNNFQLKDSQKPKYEIWKFILNPNTPIPRNNNETISSSLSTNTNEIIITISTTSSSNLNNNSTILIISIIIPIFLFILLMVGVIFLIVFYKKRKRREKVLIQLDNLRISTNNNENNNNFDEENNNLNLNEKNFKFLSNVEIEQEIGSGQFGSVYKGKWNKSIEVAMKTLTNQEAMKDFFDEMKILEKISHPNVIQYFGIFKNKNENKSFIVTEFMNKGSLLNLLHDNIGSNSFLTNQLLDFCKQACNGMIYLSNQNIIHRDLACRNLQYQYQYQLRGAPFAAFLADLSGPILARGDSP